MTHVSLVWELTFYIFSVLVYQYSRVQEKFCYNKILERFLNWNTIVLNCSKLEHKAEHKNNWMREILSSLNQNWIALLIRDAWSVKHIFWERKRDRDWLERTKKAIIFSYLLLAAKNYKHRGGRSYVCLQVRFFSFSASWFTSFGIHGIPHFTGANWCFQHFRWKVLEKGEIICSWDAAEPFCWNICKSLVNLMVSIDYVNCPGDSFVLWLNS